MESKLHSKLKRVQLNITLVCLCYTYIFSYKLQWKVREQICSNAYIQVQVLYMESFVLTYFLTRGKDIHYKPLESVID